MTAYSLNRLLPQLMNLVDYFETGREIRPADQRGRIGQVASVELSTT
jgi:hypothetical protein